MALKILILLALLTTCSALANTIVVNDVDQVLGQSSLYINENGTNNALYWAGGIDIAVDGYTRAVFCVQLFTNIYLNTTYGTTMDFSDTPNLKRVGWLLENEFPVTQAGGAAFQLAIWDIVEDNGDGFGTTTTRAGKVSQSTDASNLTSIAVLDAANKYEADSLGKSSDLGIVYHNVVLSNGTTAQTLMGLPVADSGPSPAPEPAAVLLFFSGLALIGLSRMRRGGAR